MNTTTRRLIAPLLFSTLLTACSATPTPAASPDSGLFNQATVVARAHPVELSGGSKYHFVTLQVTKVFKNDSPHAIGLDQPITAAHYGWHYFPNPEHAGLVYLVPYGDPTQNRWKIIGLKSSRELDQFQSFRSE